jgi:hypothetical protein
VADIRADIGALKEFRDALARFRYAQRDVAHRGDDEIEKTRASLEAKAGRWRSILEQRQAELEDCRRRAAAAAVGPGGGPGGFGGYGGPGYGGYGGGGYGRYVDCSSYARAVQEAEERLENIRRWRQRVEQEAGAFRSVAGRFRNLIEVEVPRTDAHLLAIIEGLKAAREVQPPGS